MLHKVRILGLFLAFLQFLSLTAAWPWPPSLENLEGLIVRRADSDTKSAAASETPKPTAKASKTAAKASNTKDNDSTITSAPASSTGAAKSKGSKETKATSGGSKTGDDDASETTKKASKTPAVDPRLPAGGVQMLTPAVTALTTYYKVGDYVTFGWNYTSLSVKPEHIDVYVTNKANQATYTISNNASYHPTGHAVWNTSADATGKAPLLTDQYTLVIHDAALDPTAQASAGYLGSYSQFTFGMYTPQPYVSKDKWKCAVCSGTSGDIDRQAMKFMLGMVFVTIVSFTWFVGGTGLLW